jgi:hypothetical protein
MYENKPREPTTGRGYILYIHINNKHTTWVYFPRQQRFIFLSTVIIIMSTTQIVYR